MTSLIARYIIRLVKRHIDASGEESYSLDEKDVYLFFSLMNGVSPSDLGMDLTEAGLLLALFSESLERSLSSAASASRHNDLTRQLIGQARQLARMFGEGGGLSGEWEDDSLMPT